MHIAIASVMMIAAMAVLAWSTGANWDRAGRARENLLDAVGFGLAWISAGCALALLIEGSHLGLILLGGALLVPAVVCKAVAAEGIKKIVRRENYPF